jgi:hypothetical protein
MVAPGVLLRLVEPKALSTGFESIWPDAPCPGVKQSLQLDQGDGETPPKSALYILDDITPIVQSPAAYDADVEANRNALASISWIVCAFINGRDKDASGGSSYTLSQFPDTSSVVVINGSTPRADKEQDYHDWYDQEHGGKLTLVPGWNAARRYRLEKAYGSVETANFYGINLYDEKNGLGGPEWKAGVTEWTMRIRSNAAKPNIRRVWKVVGTTA